MVLAAADYEAERRHSVPGRGGRVSGLQGFPSGQSSTALPPEERISERIVEQIVDFPLLEAFKIFAQDRAHLHHLSSPAGVHGSADGTDEVVLRTFHRKKKSAR